MTIPASYDQRCFRVRNDNGTETTATWVANLNTNASLNVDTNYRLRFTILVTDNSFTNQTFNLYVSKNAGAYAGIASGQAAKYSLSSNFAQGDDTTQQLENLTDPYVYDSDNNGMCESAGALNSGSNGNYFDLEYCVQIDSAQVANGDTLTFRVYRGTTALNTYTTTPSITVIEGGATTHQATASLIGASSLTTAASNKYLPTASVTGASSLTAAALNKYKPTATLAGASSLTSVGNVRTQITASLTGTSSLTTVATYSGIHQASASLAGASSLTSVGKVTTKATANLQGASSLTVTGANKYTPTASLAAASSLTAQAINKYRPTATLSGASSLVTAGKVTWSLTTAIQATSSLTIAPSLKWSIIAALAGASEMTASAEVAAPFTAAVALDLPPRSTNLTLDSAGVDLTPAPRSTVLILPPRSNPFA